jgi:hypothetical protein
MEQKELYDNMFMFTWEDGEKLFEFVKITALDKNNAVIYEKTMP